MRPDLDEDVPFDPDACVVPDDDDVMGERPDGALGRVTYTIGKLVHVAEKCRSQEFQVSSTNDIIKVATLLTVPTVIKIHKCNHRLRTSVNKFPSVIIVWEQM